MGDWFEELEHMGKLLDQRDGTNPAVYDHSSEPTWLR